MRKVDLVNVFNSAGLSCLTEQFYLDTIDEMIKEVEQLRRQVKAMERRLNGESSTVAR